MMLSLIVLLATLAVYALGEPGISYPKDSCDWIGADGMHGAYLPIGVCKHIFNPYNLSTPEDDHRYSHKYVCNTDGTVKAHAYQSDTSCHGNYDELDVRTYGNDYFECSGEGACPYAVVRFYHQETAESEQCIKSTDGWYSEAPMTTYQCLNITKNGINEWYMLKCTQDGKGLIGIDYSENCQQKLNESVVYDGCNYKDLWIEISHCDYWDEATIPFVRDITSSTQTPVSSTSTSSTTAVTHILSTIVSQSSSTQNDIIDSSSSDSDEHNYGSHSDEYHHGSHSHNRHGSHNHHHGSMSRSHSHSHEHQHGYDNEDGYGHNDHYHTDSDEMEEESNVEWPLWFFIAVAIGLIFMLLCCCITYKYMKQKQEVATFAKIVEFTMDIEGGDDVNQKDNTVVVNEGETITFK